MKKLIQRIASCVLVSALAISTMVAPAMAATEENVITNPEQDGFVKLNQYVTATEVPGVYSITLSVGAKLTPTPIDIQIVLDESGSMVAGISGGSDRWTSAKEGAKLAVNTFFNKDINAGYDMTRVAAFTFGTSAPVTGHTTVSPSAPDGFGGYNDESTLINTITNWSLTPGQTTDMSDAMKLVQTNFTTATASHTLPNYPDKSYGTATASNIANGAYNDKVKKYVIFLTDGNDTSTAGPNSAMIDYVTTMKMPYTAATPTGTGVNFYSIGLALGATAESQNSEAPAFGSGVYSKWNTYGNINPLINYQPFTDYLQSSDPSVGWSATAGGFLPPAAESNAWMFDMVDMAISMASPTDFGVSRQALFTTGYFDIPGDQYPSFKAGRPRDKHPAGTLAFVVDPSQLLIYTAMGLDFSKGELKTYTPTIAGVFGDLASSYPGAFYASPIAEGSMGWGAGVNITNPDSIIHKLDAASTSNNVAIGLTDATNGPMGFSDVAAGEVIAYYNRDTWDGRKPNFYLADTASALSDTFEEIALSIIQFGKNVKVNAGFNTEQFDLYTGFSHAPNGYTTSGASQKVSFSGGAFSWGMDAIPRSGVNSVTFYVQVKPNSYTDGLNYSILKDMSISYVDDQNFFLNGNAVATDVTKNFPIVYVNPSTHAIKDNGAAVGPNGTIVQDLGGSAGSTMNSNGPTDAQGNGDSSDNSNTMTSGTGRIDSSNGDKPKTTGSIIVAGVSGVDAEMQTYESSNKKIVITSDNAKIYQKTKSDKYKAIASVKQGATFTVLSEDDAYYKVQYMKKDAKNASVGYISKKDAKQVTKSTTPTVTAAPAKAASSTDAASASSK